MSTVPSSTPPQEASATPQRRRKDPPEKKIGPFAAGIGVCVWLNQTQTENGPKNFRSITINPRRYFDRESNQWKDSNSFNPSDLPALIYSLQLAARHCYESVPAEEQGEAGNGHEDIPF